METIKISKIHPVAINDGYAEDGSPLSCIKISNIRSIAIHGGYSKDGSPLCYISIFKLTDMDLIQYEAKETFANMCQMLADYYKD